MQEMPSPFTEHQIVEREAYSAKRICRILRKKPYKHTTEGASLQASSGNSGTPVRYNKATMGFNYILTKKGITRASSDVGFMFIANNLRRIGNILTIDVLKEYLKAIASLYFDILGLIRGISVTCDGILFHGIQMSFRNRISLKPV